MRVARVMLAVVCVISLLAPASGAAQDISTPEATYEFANWLYMQQDFQRAVGEYKRVTFFAADPTLREDSIFMLASAYQGARMWDRAATAYQDYLDLYATGRYRENALFRIAQCAFGAERYGQTKERVDALLEAYPEGYYAADGDFLVALSYLMARSFKAAERQWATFKLRHADSPLADAAARMAQCCRDMEKMPKKSAATAVILSALIPGSGQYYAGAKGDGAAAFLVNAAMIGLAINRFDRDDNTAGAVLAILAATFYSGSIYGAANAADNANQRRQADLVKKALAGLRKDMETTLGHPAELLIRRH
jgi:hypothetical protein